MNIDFNKGEGLVPVIIQNTITSQVLMLGYMNQEAYEKTVEDGVVTFFSRSKNRLWTKGETSGNTLKVDSISLDCDNDSILIQAFPAGPTCHAGTTSCFKNDSSKGFLYDLEQTISDRIESKDPNSYTNQLVNMGINKVAQKVGEEAVEVVIEAKDSSDELFKNEVSDLLYHTLILLKVKKVKLADIEDVLKARKK